MSQVYNIDRKTASRMLNVSIRTIDRYLSSGRLESIKNNGRIWISKADVLSLSHQQSFDGQDTTRQHRHVDNIADRVRETIVLEPDVMAEIKETSNVDTFKDLYEKTQNELTEKQSLLDQATYRIAQLEAQIENMVPMLEFKKQQQLLSESADQYMKAVEIEETKRKEMARQLLGELEKKKVQIRTKEKELDTERLNKAIFAVILFVILSMQPILWILLK
jgi:hypothetical protein